MAELGNKPPSKKGGAEKKSGGGFWSFLGNVLVNVSVDITVGGKPSRAGRGDPTDPAERMAPVHEERKEAYEETIYRKTEGADGTAPAVRVNRDREMIARSLDARGAGKKAAIPSGGGAPLSNDVRAKMEPRLGADLADVRVHTSGESAAAAEGLSAKAFTTGSDVHFGAGNYAPGTQEGDKLLAHELTHVVQAKHSGVQRKADGDHDAHGDDAERVSQPGDPAEKEADDVAEHVAGDLHGGANKPVQQQAPKVGAKLESVGRKIFRAKKPPATGASKTPPTTKTPTTTPQPATGSAPPAGSKPPKPPIDLEGMMKAAKKKLHVDPEKKDVKLDGLDPTALVAGAKAALPPPQDPRTPEAGPKLDAITQQLTALRTLMQSADPATDKLAALGKAVMAAMHEYGEKFDVKSFGDPLPKFPPPRAWLYNGGSDDPDKDKVPDKSTRGCHHIPPVELSKSIAREIDKVIASSFTALAGDNKVIAPAGEILKTAADNIRALNHGKGLSSIFLHKTTHKNAEGTAVHQSGIAEELQRRMKQRVDLTEEQRVPIKSTVGPQLLVNPRGKQFEPFLAECKERAAKKLKAADKQAANDAIKKAETDEKAVTKKGEDAAQADAKAVLKEQIKMAFESALAQTSTAVEVSLSVSFVDGDRAAHAGAVADLRGKARTSWKPVLDAAS